VQPSCGVEFKTPITVPDGDTVDVDAAVVDVVGTSEMEKKLNNIIHGTKELSVQ
jgi:hypothetical protein